MQDNRRLALGILLAALLVVFVIFAGITAMAEGFQPDGEGIPLSTNTASPQPTNTQDAAGDDGGQPAFPTLTNTSAPIVSVPTEMPTATFTPIAGGCAYPAGWMPITLIVGDTLADVAATYNTTVDELIAGNCLFGAGVQPGTLLYVPPSGAASSTAQAIQNPTKTSTSAVATCGAPASWVTYRIRSGDTLFSLAHAYSTTVGQLQYANCLGSSDRIVTGNNLYVPNVSKTNTPLVGTATPTLSPTPTHTPSPTINATATVVAATDTAATATSAAATSVSADATATSVAATDVAATATSADATASSVAATDTAATAISATATAAAGP